MVLINAIASMMMTQRAAAALQMRPKPRPDPEERSIGERERGEESPTTEAEPKRLEGAEQMGAEGIQTGSFAVAEGPLRVCPARTPVRVLRSI